MYSVVLNKGMAVMHSTLLSCSGFWYYLSFSSHIKCYPQEAGLVRHTSAVKDQLREGEALGMVSSAGSIEEESTVFFTFTTIFNLLTVKASFCSL